MTINGVLLMVGGRVFVMCELLFFHFFKNLFEKFISPITLRDDQKDLKRHEKKKNQKSVFHFFYLRKNFYFNFKRTP